MFRPWRVGLLATCTATLAVAGDPPPPRGPVSVFVRARPDETMPPKAEMDARKTKADALEKTYKDLRKSLKKQYGKDRLKWPVEARASYYQALDAYGMAWSANYYVARPATEKSDTVADLQKHLAKDKKDTYVTLAPTAEEADLVVEIVGRKGTPKFMSGGKWMGFDVMPGRIPAATLASLGRDAFDLWLEDYLWVLHWPRADEPYARFEVLHEQRWSDVAGHARETLNELVKDYYDVLKPAP
jgi:hypothetical protein